MAGETSNQPPGAPSSRGRRTTINDIARLANVSKKTVSRVINNSPLVRDDTRQRVEEVIKETGFTPDPQARALAFRRSFLIGMFYDNPSPQYVVNFQRGILDALKGTPYLLVVQPVERGDERLIEQITAFVQQQKPRGIILTPSISEDPEVAKVLEEYDCPYVRVAASMLDEPERSVRTEDFVGSREAARYLVAQGHRRIGHVMGRKGFLSVRERLRGFREGLAEHNIELPDELIAQGSYTFDSGAEATRALMDLPEPPTAIFLGNDEMAVGAYQALRERGLRIPEDVSIVGYDDTPMAARVWPPMTTVRIHIREIGAQAARHLLADESENTATTEFSPELVIRSSVRPL